MNTKKKEIKTKRKALGKGLGALIPTPPASNSGEKEAPAGPREFFNCPVDRIVPDPDQPRRAFDKDSLDDLVHSVQKQGVIQPLVVRKVGEKYELIAGERRWRASRLAGMTNVPVVIKDVSAAQAFEMALVENIQREDLNPIEEAEALNRLLKEHNYTQAELSDRIGKNRSTITNSLRLLGLPMPVKELVLDKQLSEGHARAILQAGTDDAMIRLAKLVAHKKLSVRATEGQARAIANGKQNLKKAVAKGAEGQSPQVKNLIDRLQQALGACVNIVDTKGKGKLEITYTSYEELDGILDKILEGR